MTRDAANRLAVRRYLLNGEQPQDGTVLITRAYPQRTLVIAKDSDGCALWGFFFTGTKGTKGNMRLYGLDAAYLIAVAIQEAKTATP